MIEALRGVSRPNSTHKNGLSTLDERANVCLANNSRRAAPMRARVFIGLQQQRARGAQIGVERVVLGLLGLLFVGGWSDALVVSVVFGVNSDEAPARGFEPGREVEDHRLQPRREGIVELAQPRQFEVGEVIAL